MALVHATVNDTEPSGPFDFSITDVNGTKLIMQAENKVLKLTWVRCIQRQVTFQTERANSIARDTLITTMRSTVFEKAEATFIPSSESEAEPELELEEESDPEVVDQPTAEVAEMIRRYTTVDNSGPPLQTEQTWDDAETKHAQVADEDVQKELENLINLRNSRGRKNTIAMVTSTGEFFLADAQSTKSSKTRDSETTEDIFQGLEIAADAATDEHGEHVLSAGDKLEEKRVEKEMDPERAEDLVHLSQMSLEAKVGRTLAKRTHPISKDTHVGHMVINVFDKKRYI